MGICGTLYEGIGGDSRMIMSGNICEWLKYGKIGKLFDEFVILAVMRVCNWEDYI